MMKDSTVSQEWLREMMAKNPPGFAPTGAILTGPVRLSFPNLFKPGKPSQDNPGGEGKYGSALLFPLGTDMAFLQRVWTDKAREIFPQNWDGQGRPIGLHSPFHDQAEKAFGAKPLMGYTPGAITFAATSKLKPQIVHPNMNPVTDESRVYPGVWAVCGLNVYAYGLNPPRPKKGVAFGLQTVMIVMDDTKLAGGGGNPTADFGAVVLTATSNVAAKFDQATPQQPAAAGIMPSGGHVGTAGHLPVHALPSETEDERIMREMMGG